MKPNVSYGTVVFYDLVREEGLIECYLGNHYEFQGEHTFFGTNLSAGAKVEFKPTVEDYAHLAKDIKGVNHE